MTIHGTPWTTYDSPFGGLVLTAGPAGLSGVHFPGHAPPLHEAAHSPEPFAEATAQLDEYFAGTRRAFDLALDLGAGTAFQQAVWRELLRIGYGTTISYGELARRIGRSDRVRAVGAANGRNPLSIVVPCHRVVGADGRLTGYLGGLHRKRMLLDLECTGARQLALL